MSGTPAASELDACLETQRAALHIPSIAATVVSGGEVAYIGTTGRANLEFDAPVTAATPFQLASVSKIFTALTVHSLAAEGAIDLDESLLRRIDEAAGAFPDEWGAVTVRHALSHTSGMPSYTEADGYWPKTRLDVSKHEVLDLVRALPLRWPPGDYGSYDNTGYYLLGYLIEAAAGQSYEDAVAARVTGPLGMTSTMPHDPYAIVPGRAIGYRWDGTSLSQPAYYSPSGTWAAGSLTASIEDMARLGQAMQGNGALPDALFEAMWTPHPSRAGNDLEVLGFEACLGMFRFAYAGRVGLAVGEKLLDARGHSGSIVGFATNVTHFLDEALTVVVLANLGEVERPDAIARGLAEHWLPELRGQPLLPPD